MISLIQILQEILFEGGNVFGTTSSIKKEYIKPTLEKFTSELKRIYPKIDFKFSTLGSVGKKDESGDIDLGMSVDQFMTKDGEPLLANWNINKGEFDALYEKIRKRSRSASEVQSKLRAMLELAAIYAKKSKQDSPVNADCCKADDFLEAEFTLPLINKDKHGENKRVISKPKRKRR